jgi:hypothetical protein
VLYSLAARKPVFDRSTGPSLGHFIPCDVSTDSRGGLAFGIVLFVMCKEKDFVAANDKQAWMALYLLSRANEEIALIGGVPGAPLDTEAWIQRHLQICPQEFAYEDWSSYQPAIHKIRLLPTRQGLEGEQ